MKIKQSPTVASLVRNAFVTVCLLGSSAHADWVTWTLGSGGNGHSYLAVPASPGLTWNVANQLAQAQGGYLATINSAAENAFVFSLINSPQFFTSYNGSGPALGGIQIAGSSEPGGGWTWTTGEVWSYTNWRPGSPDDGGGSYQENRLHFFSGTLGSSTPAATWNDIFENDPNIGGYVIEVVPEPGMATFFWCGSGLLFWRFRKQKRFVRRRA